MKPIIIEITGIAKTNKEETVFRSIRIETIIT
jgi:hypothetical protein